MSKETNLAKATSLVKTNVEARIPKAEILTMLMTELNVSKANAFVYFTKASKALGITITKDKGAVAVAKPAKGSTIVKDGKRVTKSKEVTDADVTAFFEGAKARMEAKAAAKASPFAALGI